MTVLFMEPGSAATQDMSLWPGGSGTSGTGAVTSDAQAIKGSVRSIKFANLAANDQAYVVDNVTPNDAGRRGSFYFRTAGVRHNEDSIVRLQTGVNVCWGVYISDATFKLRVHNQFSGNIAEGTTVISANTDYRISWAYTVTDSTHWTLEVYLDGTIEISISNPGVNIATGGNELHYGIFGLFSATNATQEFRIAHIVTDDGTTGDMWNGVAPAAGQPQIGVTAKLPIANGSANGFTTQIGAGGSGVGTGHAPQVNERPRSDTNGWSLNTASAVTEEYSIQAASAGDIDVSANITFIDFMGWIRAKTTGGTRTCSIVVGGVSSNISVTTSSATYTKIAGSTTYPTGNTDIGMISAAVSDTYSLYECGIVVAYQPIVITREQEGYRFRADDGSESTASWLAAQDSNISRDKLTPARLRVITNVTNDPPSEAVKLQYRRVGDPLWRDM